MKKRSVRLKRSPRRRKSRSVIPTLKKGELTKYGYSSKLPAKERRESLKKAVKKYSPLSVFRKLNAVATLNKNRSPKLTKIFNSDKNWVKRNYM